jgi:hypothetical protein
MFRLLIGSVVFLAVSLPAFAVMNTPVHRAQSLFHDPDARSLQEIVEDRSGELSVQDDPELVDFNPSSFRKIEMSMLRLANG